MSAVGERQGKKDIYADMVALDEEKLFAPALPL